MSSAGGKGARTGFLATLLLLLALAVFFYLSFRTVVVSGHSMEPTYHAGDRLLASKAYWLIGAIKRKDIVVLRDPVDSKGYIIKRVLALAGEVVDYENLGSDWKLSQGDYTVPTGEIYVIGDNRAVSEDSRKFGSVPVSSVIGKIVYIAPGNAGMSVLIFVCGFLMIGLLWFSVKLLAKK
ncbi:MAG: signal peptidase I [Armatimonadetes bacterium]|nr:signal peptidase I [Armatimonadota bacterium]